MVRPALIAPADMIDLKSADPIEGMLVSQLVVAHEGAMAMYSKAWSQPPEYFEARTRYLQLADKAQRTVVMLTERIDHHRGRGQQQITVRHVTVNADQAIVGNVEHHRGVGPEPQSKEQPHAIAHALEPAMWSQDQERQITLRGNHLVSGVSGTVRLVVVVLSSYTILCIDGPPIKVGKQPTLCLR